MKKKLYYTFEKQKDEFRRPLTTVLVKPMGPICNLQCTYCFYCKKMELFNNKVKKMSFDTIEKVVHDLCRQNVRGLSFVFQGGEPMMAGLDFFEHVVKVQEPYRDSIQIENSLQTNGILMNKKFAKFLKENDFLVGLSIDGPKEIHDHYRLSLSNKGSWSDAMKALKLMTNEEVKFNVLSVITDNSVKYSEEIYTFLKQQGVSFMQFIPCVELDPDDPTKMADYSVPPEEYGEFLCKMFDLWWDDFRDKRPTTFIRYFDDLFYAYAGQEPPDCTILKECGTYSVVEAGGELFTCDFFVEPEFKTGSTSEKSVTDAWHSDTQKEFGKRKSKLHSSCEKCPWLKFCYGGCLKDRRHNIHNTEKTYLCKAFLKFLPYANERFKELYRDYSEGT